MINKIENFFIIFFVSCMLGNTNRRAIAYGAVSFSSAAMHNIFITYYIHFFLESLEITDSWFYFGEFVFMIWNSLNDPLAGWFLDHYQIQTKNIKLK